MLCAHFDSWSAKLEDRLGDLRSVGIRVDLVDENLFGANGLISDARRGVGDVCFLELLQCG